jgi:hypothetical protein
MNQSAELDKLATALAKAQASLSGAKKSALNPHFKNNYATLQDVWEAAREVLAPNGLSVVQTYEATDGKLMNIRTTLLHESGQWIAGVLSMAPQQANPQGIASASTYGRRYGLASILGIVADEDDDGNDASEEGRAKPVYRAPAPRATQTHTEPESPAERKETHSLGWRAFRAPKFIKAHFGKELGEMPQKDILWWAANYTPKPYQGQISPNDVAFRKALDAAKAELTDDIPM